MPADGATVMASEPIQAGQVFQFSYPFVRDVFSEMDEDGVSESPTWKPGARFVNTPTGGTDTLADGIGQQILTVIGSYKPGKYPLRIFYTRQWRDPSGKVFGKGSLRIKSQAAFTNLLSGYRHEFELTERNAQPASEQTK